MHAQVTSQEIKASSTPSKRLQEALKLPSGARFFKCALQVNPWAYLVRHKKSTRFATEAEYNAAMVAACLHLGVEVVAVTDHYRVDGSHSLTQAVREAGIFAFASFEAVSKDGVHFLCIFDHDKDQRALERILGELGVHAQTEDSPIGDKYAVELLSCLRERGGVCVAAHVASNGGLLRKLSGQTRAQVWTSEELLACALAGPVQTAPDDLRAILENKDPTYKRPRPIAVLNAQDVNSPEDLQAAGSTCFIKMSSPSVEGLRQAFLDPESRIRLNADPAPEEHSEFVAMSWEGGFLDGIAVRFNENLNVLIGGRGAGKSTLIESLRYCLNLEPMGDDARTVHASVVKHVLKPGTKVSLLVRSYRPSLKHYTIERTVPNPPVVRSESGEIINLSPRDLIPNVEIFGQHEISELTKSKEKLTLLLSRFVESDDAAQRRKSEVRRELERSRSALGEIAREIASVDERLASLPSLEETLTRFREAGLEEKLKGQTLLVREEKLLKSAMERGGPLRTIQRSLSEALPIDRAFLSAKALDGLPAADLLGEASALIGKLNDGAEAVAKQLGDHLSSFDTDLAALRSRWLERKKTSDETYQKILRELQKSKIDGAEFVELRRRIEELRPLKEKRAQLERALQVAQDQRRSLVAEWEDLKAQGFRAIQRASNTVSRRLKDRVRVNVEMSGNREPLSRVLRETVGGNLSAPLERLRVMPDLSLPALADACRRGKDALVREFGIPSGSAERIAGATPELFMQIEELELPPTTQLELNVAAEGASPEWRSLDALSAGQKATAALMLLLLDSEAPLVVDQPEDDLDNRFITDGVVPTMRREKRRRQFLFSTHNANIPVLADAELIVVLTAQGDAAEGGARALIRTEHMGSIDSRAVRELVEEILEGGQMAFEMRRLKYGF
jgi:energy-coupling factor transporter ATP-binding protein EcfA2